jgi:hypothetical protein
MENRDRPIHPLWWRGRDDEQEQLVVGKLKRYRLIGAVHCLAAILAMAFCVGVAAPSLATVEKRWDKKACEVFGHVRKADMCTLDAIQGFASLTTEPAQLIAEQSVKKCSWAWRDVYDQEGHFGIDFDQYLRTWASQRLVVVLESRLPVSSPRPETDEQKNIIRIYSEKLLKDCGAMK